MPYSRTSDKSNGHSVTIVGWVAVGRAATGCGGRR